MEINYYILFSIAGLINLIVLMIIFFSKKRYNMFENKIYKILMVSTFIGIINELIMVYCVPFIESFPILKEGIAKLFLLITELWICLLAIYTSNVSNNLLNKGKIDKKKEIRRMLLIYGICAIITCILPVEYAYNKTMNSWLYTYGPSTKVVFLTSVIFITIILVYIIKNKTHVKFKKFIPVYVYIILSIIVSLVQQIDPNALLISFVETLIIFMMYFTIENPDMKLLDEVHKSKEISDNANEEKTLFLYNLTQEVRKTTSEINNRADLILDSNSLEENKDYARDIKATTSKFITMTNDILDVSKIDSANIKVYNSKYKIKNIIKQIINIYSDTCKNKEITFRTNIDHDIPEVLYGDSIGLKEVLTIILNNSCKYTEKGFIEFNVNTIIKNDICRLIITIEDSGIGIKSEDINKVKIDNKSLSKANKLITLMNGTMMISSNYGMGTKVKIILDQKIELETDNESSKYEEVFDEKKILMIDDNEASFKIIDKLLKGSNIIIDNCNNGKEAINKIKSKNKYDVILLDEELSQISGSELLKKLKEIRNFNIPVILLTKDNNYEYNEEYLKLGFVDYILKPIKKETLLEKINKYGK